MQKQNQIKLRLNHQEKPKNLFSEMLSQDMERMDNMDMMPQGVLTFQLLRLVNSLRISVDQYKYGVGARDSLIAHFLLHKRLTLHSGTFKAKYKGIYQFSVTLLCGACSNLHFELVRGTPNFGTKILAVGKAKNSEIHHTHQVTITVFAELSPNDPVKVKTKTGLENFKLKFRWLDGSVRLSQ